MGAFPILPSCKPVGRAVVVYYYTEPDADEYEDIILVCAFTTTKAARHFIAEHEKRDPDGPCLYIDDGENDGLPLYA